MKKPLTLFDNPNDAFNKDNSFHKTIPLADNKLKKTEAKCKNQEDEILIFFKMKKRQFQYHFGPWQIHDLIYGGVVPIGSVRRGMTNLTSKGKLKKTEKTRIGPYGMPEFLWELR